MVYNAQRGASVQARKGEKRGSSRRARPYFHFLRVHHRLSFAGARRSLCTHVLVPNCCPTHRPCAESRSQCGIILLLIALGVGLYMSALRFFLFEKLPAGITSSQPICSRSSRPRKSSNHSRRSSTSITGTISCTADVR